MDDGDLARKYTSTKPNIRGLMAKIAIKNWLSCALNAFIWERKPATNNDTSEPEKVSGIKKPRTEECEVF